MCEPSARFAVATVPQLSAAWRAGAELQQALAIPTNPACGHAPSSHANDLLQVVIVLSE